MNGVAASPGDLAFEADAGAGRLLGWDCHPRVRARLTTRKGGVSAGPWCADPASPQDAGGLNLGFGCGDAPEAVAENRRRLGRHLPATPRWLRQVHGVDVWRGDATCALDAPPTGASASASAATPEDPAHAAPVADAAVTDRPNCVLAVLTADCLPVLLADRAGRAVAIAHAGWRGLSQGVVERAVDAMLECAPGATIDAYLGPCIGAGAFEVGDEVRAAFCDLDARAAACFVPGQRSGKWYADLHALARQRLAERDVRNVAGEERCTVADPARFYSYRRDGVTGRMASLIWIAAHD